jgi:hypothetical protein
MQTIGEETLWSFSEGGLGLPLKSFDIRRHGACEVRDFVDLATRIAHLQFKNPNYVMLFRGQRSDHKRSNTKRVRFTSLSPRILRPSTIGSAELRERFNRLVVAEEALVARYQAERLPDVARLNRQRILRWSILQHYEICDTPLLDVTQSLRIAASFASEDGANEAFVFVLGVPNLSGAITASAEAGLQIVRLSSVCPPDALRPHIQEGYLLGEYPEIAAYGQKRHYGNVEIDFGRRLVAKFRFNPATFWKRDAFPPVRRAALYPDAKDPFFDIARDVKSSLAGVEAA